mmetsp:Transcript_16556/g.34971  ORF Transcript_16556/g.34971 Transcript_16556/m.34971 type:complete len:203 (+) Transcript_16556:1-609(+)
MAQKTGAENFSLGVTQLLDELLADEGDAGGDPASSSPPQVEDEEAVSRAFQRTADLTGAVKAHMSSLRGQDGERHWEAVEREMQADDGLDLKATLASTGGIAAALEANDSRLARLRREIEDLRKFTEDVLADDPLARTYQSVGVGSDGDTDEEVAREVLDSLLNECDALRAETGRWQGGFGLVETPKGWRRLSEEELEEKGH